jgi:hypothetical protein
MDKIQETTSHHRHSIGTEHTHELMTEPEAAAYLGVSVSGMRKWRARHCGLAYARFFRIVRYRRSDLDEFVQARIVADDSEEQE